MPDINIEQFLPRFPQQPLQQIWGLVPKYNNTTSIDVLPGACMDDTDSVRIDWTLTKTKELVGAANNTIYNIFAIKNPGTGATDVHLDTNMVSPTLPGGYTFKRWLGWCTTNHLGDIRPWDMMGNGNYMLAWYRSRHSIATGLTASTWTVQNLSSWFPAGVSCMGLFSLLSPNNYVSHISRYGIEEDIIFGPWNTPAYPGHNNQFLPIINNQIYFKCESGTTAQTLIIRAFCYWR